MTVSASAIAAVAEGGVSAGKYAHDVIAGRVDCRRCGARAFSRNPTAIAHWQMAHDKCCKGFREGVPSLKLLRRD